MIIDVIKGHHAVATAEKYVHWHVFIENLTKKSSNVQENTLMI